MLNRTIDSFKLCYKIKVLFFARDIGDANRQIYIRESVSLHRSARVAGWTRDVDFSDARYSKKRLASGPGCRERAILAAVIAIDAT